MRSWSEGTAVGTVADAVEVGTPVVRSPGVVVGDELFLPGPVEALTGVRLDTGAVRSPQPHDLRSENALFSNLSKFCHILSTFCQHLEGSFSAASKPIFASQYAIPNYVDLVDLEAYYKMNACSQNSASTQPRPSPPKFGKTL